jgi:hypothetical protein
MDKGLELTWRDWFDYWRNRAVCLVKDHDLAGLVRWSPDTICVHVMCSRCGKGIGHLDIPSASTKKVPTEKLH